ncbi:MAG: nucleotide exchange factor GrpE [Muribaculaceae bacterium]|nr:nucleotide exchange factor GrpE [Muribaculaceae bacterium]
MCNKDQHKKGEPQSAPKTEEIKDEPEVFDVLDEDETDDNVAEAELDENARLQNELDEARAAIEKEKKDYLFLMADFDNYRKRVTREKADLLKNAAERVLLGFLPIVDDFERGLDAAASDTSAEAVREGMVLIYNKLMKYLESQGVKVMESNGADFNPDFHEAIATIPAPSEELKGKVIDTTQKGYMLNDKVLRHAKVAVGE